MPLTTDKMSSIANVERKIRRIEGFRVRILHLTGADVRGDREGLPQYAYHRAAENDITVETWKTHAFVLPFPVLKLTWSMREETRSREIRNWELSGRLISSVKGKR